MRSGYDYGCSTAGGGSTDAISHAACYCCQHKEHTWVLRPFTTIPRVQQLTNTFTTRTFTRQTHAYCSPQRLASEGRAYQAKSSLMEMMTCDRDLRDVWSCTEEGSTFCHAAENFLRRIFCEFQYLEAAPQQYSELQQAGIRLNRKVLL